MPEPSKRAVIVGNSDGIGLALTRHLLADGWLVTGLSRSRSELAGPRYRHQTVDVTAPEYPDVLAGCVDALGRVDLCVYSAGIGDPIDLTDLAPQTRTLEVNLLGAARTMQVVVPRMVAAGGGHVIGLSSLADVLISGDAPGYAASKAGLSAYLLGLAAAVRPHGVRVTVVRFGFVDTKMAKGPTKPFMISVDRAVAMLLRCMRKRPAVVSVPRRMAVLVRVHRAATALRLRLGVRTPPASGPGAEDVAQ